MTLYKGDVLVIDGFLSKWSIMQEAFSCHDVFMKISACTVLCFVVVLDFPSKGVSKAELWCFFYGSPKLLKNKQLSPWLIWDVATVMWRNDVTVTCLRLTAICPYGDITRPGGGNDQPHFDVSLLLLWQLINRQISRATVWVGGRDPYGSKLAAWGF